MARKRLNKNVVLILTLFAFLLMIIVSALMLQRIRRRDPQYFVALARQYEDNEEWSSAVIFYKKAWDRSQDPAHLVSLGSALLNHGDLERAVASWRQALISRPSFTDAHLRNLELLLEIAELNARTARWTMVQEAAETFLASEAPRTDAQAAFAHHANGLALIGLADQDDGNAQRGEAQLNQAMVLAPDDVDYAIDLANHLLREDRRTEGEQLFADLIERYSSPGPQAAKVRLANANYLTLKDEYDQAEQQYQQSLTLAADAPEARRDSRLGYAAFLTRQWMRGVQRGDENEAIFDQAETILKECVRTDPDAYDAYLSLTVLFRASDRHEDVIASCESRLKRGLSRQGVNAARNRLYAFQLMMQASQACVALAVDARGRDDEASRNEWLAKADDYVADARGELPSHPRIAAQSGRIKLARGLDREALEDLRSADEIYRSAGAIDWDNKLTLARVHLSFNEAGAAVSVLEEAVGAADRLPPHDAHRFWTLFAQALLANNELNRSLDITERVLAADADNADALRVKAAVLERQGRLVEAGTAFESATGNRIVAAILTAQQHALEGNLKRCVDVLQETLVDHPGDRRLVGAIVRALLRLDKREEARAIIDEALTRQPDDTSLKALAILAREDLSPKEREQAILEMINSVTDAHQRAVERTGFFLRKDDHENALPAIDEALSHMAQRDTPAARSATVGQHRALLSAKLTSAARLNNTAAMDEARDAAVRTNLDGAGGKSFLGLYHMQRQDYNLAVRAFREAAEMQPTDTLTLTYLGQSLHQLGQSREAQTVLERAILVSPNDPQAQRSLAVVAKARGDTVAFDKSLRQCARLLPNDTWVQSQLVEQQEQADPEKAIERRKQLLERDPEDLQNLVKLVDLCERAGDITAAAGYSERLLDLHPDDGRLLFAVSKFFLRNELEDRGLEVLEEFAASRTTDHDRVNAKILLASWYQDQNEPERVEATLLAAAELAETLEVQRALAGFYLRTANQPRKALPWLEKAVQKARSLDSNAIATVMAQRVSCVLHPTVNDLSLARRYVDQLLGTVPNDPQGLLLSSEVHARLGQIDDAIDALTEHLRAKPDNVRALYQRALHQCAQGRPQAAVDDLEATKRIEPLALELKPRRLLARLHLQAGRTDNWLRELEAMVDDAPSSDIALELLVRAYAQQERLSEAERLVTARINRSTGQAAAPWLYLRSQIALALDDGQKALADAQLSAAAADYDPDSLRRVLTVHARLGRSAEGVAFYRRHKPAETTDPALRSQFALLLAGSGDQHGTVVEFRSAMAAATGDAWNASRTITGDLRSAYPTQDLRAQAIERFKTDAPRGQPGRANDRILIALFRIDNHYQEAFTRLEALIASSSDDQERTELLRELGDVHQVAEQTNLACRAYEDAIKYGEDNWIALNNLAYLLCDPLGEYERARAFAVRAVAAAESFATLDTLGWIQVGMGDYATATATLNQAIRLDPQQALAYYHLGEAYRRSGLWTQASNVLRRGQDLARSTSDEETLGLMEQSLGRVGDSDSRP